MKKVKLIKESDLSSPSQPINGFPPERTIQDGQATNSPDGYVYLEVMDRPSYDSETEKLVRDISIAEGYYGWKIVALTDEEITTRINQEAEQAKQATRQKVEQSIVEERRLEEVTRINTLTDEEAAAEVDLFPPFEVGKSYETGERFQFRGMGYHTHAPFVGAVHQLPGMPGLEALFTPLPLPSDEDPCDTAPAWNSDDYLNYVVDYQVKSGNAVWKATNTTHTYIEPAETGNGAISWEKVKDCP